MTPLYAKSFDEREGAEENAFLLSHLKISFWAAQAILDRTGKNQLAALGIDESQYERFRRIVLLAAAIHDLGKANSLFQAVVRGIKDGQSIRHEWVLYLLLRHSPLGEWIRSALKSDTDFTILVWTVAGHHRKEKGEETTPFGVDMELLLDADDFQACLDWIAEEFRIIPAPRFDKNSVEGKKNRQEMEKLSEELEQPGRTIADETLVDRSQTDRKLIKRWTDEEPDNQSLMAAVRSMLMAADVTASALADPEFSPNNTPLIRERIEAWVTNHLGDLPIRDQYQKVVEHRLEQIAANEQPGPKNEMLDREREAFQNETADSQNRVTLLVAGCGSGKTLAAFRWAVKRARDSGNRLFFGYPTTGTATEGFLDYLLDDDKRFGNLVHSRVAVDFLLDERMRNAASDGEDHSTEIVKSLRLWDTKLVCCTVDTMLGFLVNTYSGHLSWPVFAQSLFIFDEIHSYDEKLFGYLIKFLRIIRGTPILLMTASLPKKRLEKIRDAVEQGGEKLGVVSGPKEWEKIKRYRRFLSDCDPVDAALERYERGEKILWVCNTVNRAIAASKKIKERRGDCRVIVYHSHFRYEDRVARHRETVEAFKKEESVICVTTQVAEMSLDISADFLLMDLAPIPAMIQRLGRLNRRAIFDGALPFMILFPEKENGEPDLSPYKKPEVRESNAEMEEPFLDWYEESRRWLDALGEEPLSQADLAETWKKMASNAELSDRNGEDAPWFSPGPWMSHSNLREASPGCEVILQEDFDAIRHGGRVEYLRRVIPMSEPYIKGIILTKHPKFRCYIVKNGTFIDYDAELGGRWKQDLKKTPDGIKEIQIY